MVTVTVTLQLPPPACIMLRNDGGVRARGARASSALFQLAKAICEY